MSFSGKIIGFNDFLSRILYPLRITLKQEVGNSYINRPDRARIAYIKNPYTKRKELKLEFQLLEHKPVDPPSNECLELTGANWFSGWFDKGHYEFYYKKNELFPIQSQLLPIKREGLTAKMSGVNILTETQKVQALRDQQDIKESVKSKKTKNPMAPIVVLGFIILGLVFLMQTFMIYSFETHTDNAIIKLFEALQNAAEGTYGGIEQGYNGINSALNNTINNGGLIPTPDI
jgi:hypothetical protein